MQLHFRKTGNGRPLIILHGLFGSSGNWQTLANKFAENTVEVFLVDQRNHGHSEHDPVHNYHVMADDIKKFIARQNISSPAVLGHSMGGKTAMQLGLDYPDIISKLIVIDMAPKKYPPLHNDVLEALISVDFGKQKSRKQVEEKLSEKIKDTGTLQFLLKSIYWKNDTELAWRFNLPAISNQIGNMSEAVKSNNTFQKPALFIKGEKSNYIPPEDEAEIKNIFPLAEIKTAPQSGHWVHADNPQWLFETCLSFVNG